MLRLASFEWICFLSRLAGCLVALSLMVTPAYGQDEASAPEDGEEEIEATEDPVEEPVEDPIEDPGEEPVEEPVEDSGLFYDEPEAEEEPAEEEPAAEEPVEPESDPLPLRAAPDDTVDDGMPVRDPTTTTAATYGKRYRDKESGKKVLFGEHRIRLSLARPEFEDLEFYDTLYGDEKNYFMVNADWFAWDWYATLGLSLRFGYYTATGFTADSVDDADDVSEDDLEVNRDGPTSLTLLPFQLVGTMEFTPFDGKWLVIDAWAGYERLYFQEARTVGGASDTASVIMLQDTESDDDDDGTPVNSGWSSGTTVGVSANILLNALDDRGARSLRSIGLGYIYLSPFMEIVTTVNDNDVPFGRSVVGLGFTFESLR